VFVTSSASKTLRTSTSAPGGVVAAARWPVRRGFASLRDYVSAPSPRDSKCGDLTISLAGRFVYVDRIKRHRLEQASITVFQRDQARSARRERDETPA